jgi:hypothetical protein
MNDSAKRRSDELTETAISAAMIADFREAYRERLRWLKETQPQAFNRALAHYNEILVPNIAEGTDPIAEWLEYGKLLGNLSGPGKILSIDETGRAGPASGVVAGLLLHLPDDTGVPALALAIPKDLSDAQRATLNLLVKQR